MLPRAIGRLNRPQTFYILGIVFVFLISLNFARSGVDFGPQWDQNLIKGFVNKYVRTGSILPGEYIYPPGSSYIASSTLIPYALPFIQRYGLNWTPTQQYLLDEVLKEPNRTFLLNLRQVFVFSTLLAILWTGLAAGQRDWLAGLVAAAALAFSWEINYHSRLVHPDGPTMQFGALALLFGFLALYRKRPFNYRVWLALSAIAAAAATATKYTAGITLFILLALAYALFKGDGFGKKKIILSLLLIILVFVATFILLVPGVILETDVFLANVSTAQDVYSTGHGLQTVDAGWDYLQRTLLYVFLAAFSNTPVLAVFIPGLSLVGVYSLLQTRVQRDSFLALALAGVPLLYMLFLATHRVLFVRNLLIIFPNLAILAGFGLAWLLQKVRSYALTWRLLPIGGLLVIFGLNALWISHATWTIQMRGTGFFVDQALDAISQRADQKIYITPAALHLLGERDLPTNVALQYHQDADLVLFAYLGDTRDEDEGRWPVNWPSASPLVFGPKEINMDWYASWPGAERLVLSPPELAWQDGARLGEDPSGMDLEQQEIEGTLSLDGEQFFVEVDRGERIYILNSANPDVIIALKDLVNSMVSIVGRPYSFVRDHDWFLLALNGSQVVPVSEVALQFRTTRVLANLSGIQKECMAQALGEAKFLALTDNMMPLVDFSKEELIAISACIKK